MLREPHELTVAEDAACRALGSLAPGVGAGWWHQLVNTDPVPAEICDLIVTRLEMGEVRHPGRWLEVNNLTEALEEAVDGIVYLCMAYGRRREPPADQSIGYRVGQDEGWREIGRAIDAQIAAAVAICRAIETCEARP